MIELLELPYYRNGLEPHISERTIDYHYGKHHAAYVKNLNALISGTAFDTMELADIVRSSEGSIFNNAAQTWNHSFYWRCMTPLLEERAEPEGDLLAAICRDFISLEAFREQFIKMSASLFGSGWTWLVSDSKGKLSVVQTENAKNPLVMDDCAALLCCDVWEHAYYLDRQNLRQDYLNEFWKVINWRFVEKNYVKACKPEHRQMRH